MKPPCESVIKEILPSVRALIAKRLVEDYGFSQQKAAMKMHVTQPAVSQYRRGLRGRGAEYLLTREFIDAIDAITKRLAEENLSEEQQGREFCTLCALAASEKIVCERHGAGAALKPRKLQS